MEMNDKYTTVELKPGMLNTNLPEPIDLNKKYKETDNVCIRAMRMRADPRLKVAKDALANMGKYSYSFNSIEQISRLSADVCIDYGLLLWSSERNVEYTPRKVMIENTFNNVKTEKEVSHCIASVIVDLINVDNPTDKLLVEGHGEDEGDRADGKSLTYAERRAMKTALGISDSESEPEREPTKSESKKETIEMMRERATLNQTVTPPIADIPEPPKKATILPKPADAKTVPPMPAQSTLTASVSKQRAELRKKAATLFEEGRLSGYDANTVKLKLSSAKTEEDCDEIVDFLADNTKPESPTEGDE